MGIFKPKKKTVKNLSGKVVFSVTDSDGHTQIYVEIEGKKNKYILERQIWGRNAGLAASKLLMGKNVSFPEIDRQGYKDYILRLERITIHSNGEKK